jgi:hypothetical protein
MAGDKIIINTLERALSVDVNDLQSMQARVLADWLLELAAFRAIEFYGGPQDAYPQSVTMGLSCRGGGAFLTVQSGVLGQASFIWPAAPLPLESIFRIGISRADVSVPVPAVPNTLMILEAQVVDVTTVSSVRDVFDVPTQTFIPTPLPKQAERRIQFQVIQGNAASLPAFSGDPWVPILGFVTDGAGLVPALPSGFCWDMRNDLKDLVGDDPLAFAALPALPDAQVTNNAAHTPPPGGGVDDRIGGNFQGRIGWMRCWLRADSGVIPQTSTSIVSPAFDRFEHYYLAPLSANGVTVMPSVSAAGFFETAKGILWVTETQPDSSGRDNSAPITAPPATFYSNFDPVPAHRAVHVMSNYREGAFEPRPATQTSGGACTMLVPVTSLLANVASRASAALAAPATVTLDLRGIIPANARSVTVSMRTQTDGINPGTAVVSAITPRLEPLIPYAQSVDITDGGTGQQTQTNRVVELPCHYGDGTLEGQRFDINLVPSGVPTVALEVSVIGWSL